MAPYQPKRLAVPMSSQLYSSTTTLASSTSDWDPSSLSPRALYAQCFDCPESSRSLPSGPTRYNNKKTRKDMTAGFGTTEDEFDSLPIAVRRKYFSTLERLRFAESARSNAINDLPIQSHRKTSLADRRGLHVPVIDPRRQSSSYRRVRKNSRSPSNSSNDLSWFLALPDKIKRKQFTREEHIVLTGRLRESVILDAADEAIYKASRRASRNLTPLDNTPSSPSDMSSMDGNPVDSEPPSEVAAAMYESFRWIDEDDDLDLKLVLDDYHANLEGVVIPSPTSNRRPSFRRTMSISKMPFGRTSFSSIHRSPNVESPPKIHFRKQSRALSILGQKHTVNEPRSSIDPSAAHYQDPEARLKLRVYLASPQKFDEAIEFGFPSLDGLADTENKENKSPRRSSKEATGKKSHATEKSFFDDGTASLFEDDHSMLEPDSPLTPMNMDTDFRFQHRNPLTDGLNGSKTSTDSGRHGVAKATIVKQAEGYTQAMAGNREMTLRMTLTRPDLRADESKLYGWQTASKSPLREETLALGELDEKYEIKGPLGGLDGWGPVDKENGVVKRIWNRVRSSQRKSS